MSARLRGSIGAFIGVVGLLVGAAAYAPAHAGLLGGLFAALPPGAPSSVTATPSATSTNVAVSWGAVAGSTGYSIAAYRNSDGSEINGMSCTSCTSTVVPGLAPGTYYFTVFAVNAQGSSNATKSNLVTVTSGCETGIGYCVHVDATQQGPTIRHIGDGILHSGLDPNMSLVTPMGINQWRIEINPTANGGLDTREWNTATQAGAASDLVLSDAWFWASNGGCGSPSMWCGAQPPWNNIGAYSSWVQSYVHQVEAAGYHPTYWTVQNEPDNLQNPGSYFNQVMAGSANVAHEEQEFLAAYNAIKAVDPSAQIIGPSLSSFRPSPDSSGLLDLQTFLSFSSANNLKWASIDWHEWGDTLYSDWGPYPDETFANHVAVARAMVASDPNLGSPTFAVTEYGRASTFDLPGWRVGDLAALESSGAAYAGLTCPVTKNDPAVSDPCDTDPTVLDGLLLAGGSPTADYWAMTSFAGMHGNRVTSTPSDVTLSSVASIDSSQNVQVLVGRHVSCTIDNNADCSTSSASRPVPTATAAPADTQTYLTLPWSGPTAVTLSSIPNQRGAVTGPTTITSTVISASSGGQLSILMPQLADGAAYLVTAKPAAGSGPVTTPPTTTPPPSPTTTVAPATTTTQAPTTTAAPAAPPTTKSPLCWLLGC